MAALWTASIALFTPQRSGPPTLTELQTGVWKSLTVHRELATAHTHQLKMKTRDLNPSVAAAIAGEWNAAFELWIWRNDKIMAQGPLIGWEIDDQDVTLSALGLASYTSGMIQEVLYWTFFLPEDQFTTIANLIGNYQLYVPYGNFGLDTSTLGTSGVTAYPVIPEKDHPDLFKWITDYGLSRDDGFDWWVEEGTRRVKAASPFKGVDLSDEVVIDHRAIKQPKVASGRAFGSFATRWMSVNTNDGDSTAVSIVRVSDDSLAAIHGAIGMADDVRNMTDADLLSHSNQMLTVDGEPVLELSPETISVEGFEPGDFDYGDWITYSFDAGMGMVDIVRRVKQVEYSVDDAEEAISVVFV